MILPSQILFKECYGKYAIPAVNVFTMEQIHGLFSAAQDADAPIMVQLTPVARNYAHPEMLKQMIEAAAKIYPGVAFSVHLDHGDEDSALRAINEGYNSVMIDASHEDFETNVQRTKNVVYLAHKKNIAVEAELGVLSGVEDNIKVEEKFAFYTDPLKAKEFVERTGCDSLAVAVGTRHGAYKFSGGGGLQFDILSRIQQELPGFPLVLHGASSVKKEIISNINNLGGKLNKDASGVADDQIKQAVGYGVCKINIATDLRLMWTKVHRNFFVDHPDQFDPVTPGREYINELKDFLIERFEVLGANGKTFDIK